MRSSILCCAAALLLVSGTAWAEDKEVWVPDKEEIQEEKSKDGVDWRLSVGATFNMNDNRRVVGQPDGSNITFGYKLDAADKVRAGRHELRNGLGIRPA